MGAALEELGRQVWTRAQLPTPETRRTIRVSAGVSLAEIARAAGVTRQTARQWEQGTRRPKGRNLETYSLILKMLRDAVAQTHRDDPRWTPEMTVPGSDRAGTANDSDGKSSQPRPG